MEIFDQGATYSCTSLNMKNEEGEVADDRLFRYLKLLDD